MDEVDEMIIFFTFLLGCGSETDEIPFIGWTPLAEPPVLGGDPMGKWWLRGNYAPVSEEVESFDLEVIGEFITEALHGSWL